VYLGAAPGVGKTHAMLDEGLRRASRGNAVVIGVLDASEQGGLAHLTSSLERVPPLLGEGGCPELDVEAVLRRHPQTTLVDDLAHRDATGRARWESVEALLESGLDVITTVNISNIESLADVVEGITGVVPTETVPDSIVCTAAGIELVDMSPEALRRRLAHGHVYPPERVDVALANLFRPHVLNALRQLALLWMADRVEEDLERALLPDLPDEARSVRERIVLALSGEGGEDLVRRAVRLAGRSGAHVIGVHVVSAAREPGPDLERQRRLLTALGGSYREVVGDDVADALATFAHVEQATQIVLGARRHELRSKGQGAVVTGLVELIGTADIHVVPTGKTMADGERSRSRRWRRDRSVGHTAAAWTLCLVGLPLLTLLLTSLREHVSVGSALLLDLCVVMAVAALGGVRVGLVASFLGLGLTNWFLTPPLHTLTVSESQNVVALSVFVIVTVVVSVLVDQAARRSREAASANAEAAALARSAATLVGAHDPLPDLVEQVRATFGLAAASVLERTEEGWWPTHTSGRPELVDPADGTSIDLSPDGRLRLVVSDDALRPEQLHVLRAFADQLAMAVEARRLRADAANADLIAEADALRSALLQAVSHDFRTPLATIKASASGLLQPGAAFTDEDRRVLLRDIDGAADRLDRMVRDLLDMSRLQAGVVEIALRPVALEEVVAAALAGIPSAPQRVKSDVSASLPLVLADPALLERALANLVSNSIAWSPDGVLARVEAGHVRDSIDVRVIDRGPGVAPADRDRIFVPFQRFGDRSSDAGAGLGLAIAKGFVEAMGARLDVDDTPGGGLTMTVRLLVAHEDEP
jgi:two-component system, OmpR family, sensor histidine kinase KdpD